MTDTQAPHPLRSVHTQSLTELLARLGASLAITTYQAGKLIIARVDGELVNTHFRLFEKPMGMAVRPDRIALGSGATIEQLRNLTDLAPKLTPKGRHDACYLSRQTHVTGDIDVHEMAWAEDELWFINTRFSCLCTLDADHSFVPRWRPPFISGYDVRDRCHLNGLAIRDGRPRYVTALSNSDQPQGWRRHKANGGLLMDLDGDRVLLDGLSMPHSPRWHDGRLWLLESGRGALCHLDPASGRLVTVAELPGFTRGLDLVGDLAFIGLSQVRESAVFAGLPLTRTQPVRHCGVWVVELSSGRTLAFLRFEEGVQEVFAVGLLPWRFPEIAPDEVALARTAYVLPAAALAEVQIPPEDWEQADQHFERGNQAYNAGRVDEALAAYRRALELQPDFLPARYNLGVVLGNRGEYAAATALLEQVIAAEAGHADAHNSLGFLEAEQNRHAEAARHFERAIAIAPKHAQAHHNLGLSLLRQGDYARGFDALEWRWRTPGFTPFNPPQPRWDGRPCPDKTLLLHTEQGAGDVFQMARFIPWAAARVGRLVLVAAAPLKPLLEQIDGVAECRGAGALPADSFDCWLPMMSLPLAYGLTPDKIPAADAYLRPPAGERPVLPPTDRSHRVGICWAGSPTHGQDAHRSSRLADWRGLLELSDVQCYSLQKGEAAEAQLATLRAEHPAVDLIDLAPLIQDWGDTAALLQQLDLLIAVDTGIVHLAGALGRPVWTLVYRGADWRYPQSGEAMPWYPSMRLFHQQRRDDWAPLLQRVAEALAAHDWAG